MPELIEKVAWIRLEDGQVLAARTHGKTLFYLPGGKPEPGESNEQALAREIAEELGVTLHLRVPIITSGRSGRVCVLVKDATESVTSMDVQPVESVGAGDRFGGRPQGCCAVQGAVGPMRECVEQVGLVPDQQPSAASPHAGGRVNLWVCAGDASVSPGGGC
ncbi:NUDIX domain-containing protein [Actinacidiphila soli]|uniref:NUDIX domain-containing protein n=1 Tax=Actinacidiphila soli TaxID=2487275 RepID=UPI001F0C1B2C|nr:NUDIX domain-containing protein [Actinacidiphila soli]